MNLKRLLFLSAIAFAIFFIVNSPNEAAKLVKETGRNAGDWFETAADSLSQFLKTLI